MLHGYFNYVPFCDAGTNAAAEPTRVARRESFMVLESVIGTTIP
jgi:hypothetical protein